MNFFQTFRICFTNMQLRSSIFRMDQNGFAKKVNFHSGNPRTSKTVPSDTSFGPLIDPKEIKHIKSVIKSGQAFLKSTLKSQGFFCRKCSAPCSHRQLLTQPYAMRLSISLFSQKMHYSRNLWSSSNGRWRQNEEISTGT